MVRESLLGFSSDRCSWFLSSGCELVATRDSGHGPDAGVSGRGADCVAAAQADADHADPGRVYLGPVREHADRGSQVGQFSLAVLMLAAAAAFPPAPMVKGERGETGRGEQFGVGADDLLFDPGEGTVSTTAG